MNGSELSKSELPALGIVAGLEEDDRRLRDDLNALPDTYPEPAGHLL